MQYYIRKGSNKFAQPQPINVMESQKQRNDFRIIPTDVIGTSCCPGQVIIGCLANETDIFSPEEF